MASSSINSVFGIPNNEYTPKYPDRHFIPADIKQHGEFSKFSEHIFLIYLGAKTRQTWVHDTTIDVFFQRLEIYCETLKGAFKMVKTADRNYHGGENVAEDTFLKTKAEWGKFSTAHPDKHITILIVAEGGGNSLDPEGRRMYCLPMNANNFDPSIVVNPVEMWAQNLMKGMGVSGHRMPLAVVLLDLAQPPTVRHSDDLSWALQEWCKSLPMNSTLYVAWDAKTHDLLDLLRHELRYLAGFTEKKEPSAPDNHRAWSTSNLIGSFMQLASSKSKHHAALVRKDGAKLLELK